MPLHLPDNWETRQRLKVDVVAPRLFRQTRSTLQQNRPLIHRMGAQKRRPPARKTCR